MEKTLKQELLDAGMQENEIENRYSDLYVLRNKISTAFIAGHACKSMTTTFRSQIDGKLWFDIPFGYMAEYVEARNKKRNPFQAVCKGCNKTPNEITEYVTGGKIENCSPQQYVRNNEGTFNPVTGRFYCTSCYIKAGQPLGKA